MKIGRKFTVKGVKYEFLGYAASGRMRVRQIGSEGVITIRTYGLARQDKVKKPHLRKKKPKRRAGRRRREWRLIGGSGKLVLIHSSPTTPVSRVPTIISVCKSTILTHSDRLDAPLVGNLHPLSLPSQRSYEGGLADEVLIAVCEGMIEPEDTSELAGMTVCRGGVLELYEEIFDGALTPWNLVSFVDDPSRE